MFHRQRPQTTLSRFAVLIGLIPAGTLALLAQPARIVGPIANSERFLALGHVHPKARPEYDRGRVAPALEIPSVALTFAPSESQQSELDRLLSDQQDPSSANYHHWITPEEYGLRFGISEADLATLTAWLQSQGLTVESSARARNWIVISGSAAQVESAFGTEIHQYVVDGETHFANATEPSLPVALRSVVKNIRGLHDFRMKPASRRFKAQSHAFEPDYKSSGGNNYLSPGDLAIIYNIAPLYRAGIDGSGQKLVIAGQTQVTLTNLQQFRTRFALPANDPQLILAANSRDPGVQSGDVDEANLDLEWSGAVAQKASIIYVYANDVMQSVQYAIDQNLAPVISTSYGSCEPETPSSDIQTFRTWAKQANSQGITWFSASGDAGAADCNDTHANGLAVDVPASIPEVTGVGGTEFTEGSGQYWNAAASANGTSVLSYIPEKVWNDSISDGQPAASGGGPSAVFSKPAWQTGPGVPDDNARHVPDVSLAASADHDGYLVYTGGKLQVFGGTSVPAPSFAGLAVLINQYLVVNGKQSTAGLGNINPTLYSLAQSAPAAFHDITSGDNSVTVHCGRGAGNCSSGPLGFSAGIGYDQATGLGSVDAFTLASAWSGAPVAAPAPSAALSFVSNAITAKSTDVILLIATVTDSSGNTPSGTVVFSAGAVLGSSALIGSGGKATATLEVSGAQLLQSSGAVTATYTGSGSPAGTSAMIAITIQQSSVVGGTPSITSLANAASFAQAFAPGALLSVFGTSLAPSVQSAGSIPLPATMGGVSATIDGVPAPLSYLSPTQINLQIPYETAVKASAVLRINNNGQIASRTLAIAAAGPGIFTGQNSVVVPNASAARGQLISLYVTGGGAVTPQLATGTTPASSTAVSALPAPTQAASVTIGGVTAPIQFIGNSPGLVGVLQINVQVPTQAVLGSQAVVVTIGRVASASARLTVN